MGRSWSRAGNVSGLDYLLTARDDCAITGVNVQVCVSIVQEFGRETLLRSSDFAQGQDGQSSLPIFRDAFCTFVGENNVADLC